jgi:hypothetical protein
MGNHFRASSSASAPLSAVNMKDHGNFCFVLGYDARDAAQPVMNTDDVELVSFFLDQVVDELRCA